MKKILQRMLVGLAIVGVGFVLMLTRDGTPKVPVGNGTLALDEGAFEAFPLPEYAAAFINDDYKSYLIEVEPGIKIHVIEVGSGYPVYMQHGLPTSGFLYRNVAQALPQDQFRIIMPTMVGLGFSSKVPASQITYENQVRWMNIALNALGLEDLIFVGHDWGGPIGVAALARSPDIAKGAVILNTVLDAPTQPLDLATPLQIMLTPVVGEVLFEGLVSIFGQLPGLQNDPASMPDDVIDLYARPVQDSGNTKGPLAIARMSVTGPDHPDFQQLVDIETYATSWDIPTEIVWGMNDPILKDRLDNMRGLFPAANVTRTNAGHFLQEETPTQIAEAIQRIRSQIAN